MALTKLEDKSNIPELFAYFHKLYKEGNNCDLTLISEDSQQFYVHASIMLTSVPQLRQNMIVGNDTVPFFNMISRQRSHEHKRRVPKVKARELAHVVDFAYLEFCTDLKENDQLGALELIKVANYLHMTKLKDYAEEILEANLDMATALYILVTEKRSTKYSLRKARKMSRTYILRNLVTDQSSACNRMSFGLFKDFIKSDHLHAVYEEMVWETIVRWVQHDERSRKRHVPELMQILRVGMIHPAHIENEIEKCPLITGNPAAMQVLSSLRGLVNTIPSNNLSLPLALQPRVPHHVILLTGGTVYDDVRAVMTSTMLAFDHMAERWVHEESICLPSTEWSYHAVAVIDRSMYLIGGHVVHQRAPTCWRLDFDDMMWHRITNMLERRYYMNVAALGGRLYVVGGTHKIHRTATVEIYDPISGIWSNAGNMQIERSDVAVAVLDDLLYVIGGSSIMVYMDLVEVFDPATNKWTTKASLIYPRGGLGCVAYRQYIFAVGGRNGLEWPKNIERYDSTTNTWSLLAPMSVSRTEFGIALIADKIYVFGGTMSNGQMTESCEVYHILEDKWYPLPPLRKARSGHACCVVDDIDISSKILGSISKRDDALLFRTPNVERPRYTEDYAALVTAPRTTLEEPVMGPLPQDWLDLFASDQQQDFEQQIEYNGDGEEHSAEGSSDEEV